MCASLMVEIPWLIVTVAIGPTLSYFMVNLSPSVGVFFVNFLAVYLLGENALRISVTVDARSVLLLQLSFLSCLLQLSLMRCRCSRCLR